MGDMLSRGSAFPVELPRQGRAALTAPAGLGFAAGVGVGLILAAIGVQIWLAFHLAPVAGTWAAFHADSIANLSRLSVSDEWRCGVPAVGSVALAALLLARVKRARWYALVAALTIAAAIATYLWATAPWTALADTIR